MPQKKLRRWLRRIRFTMVALVLIALPVAWLLLRGSLAQLDGIAHVPGIANPVLVERDELGTATISAKNRLDLAWATGFVHAQERYFQMDLLRRVAAGELAELFGSVALATDRGHRVHRFRARAMQILASLTGPQRDLIERYRDGVNAGLANLGVRPWEYLLLRMAPEPWRNEDTLLVIDSMFLDLNGDGANLRELNLSRLHASVPEPVFRFLLAPGGEWDAPLRGEKLAPLPIPAQDVLDLHSARTALVYDHPERIATVLAESALRNGSNNFAVGGGLVGGGAALVANDMHLGLRVPNIWYRARLRYPDPDNPGETIDLNGVTLPGTPALIAGSNGHIAWGYTNSYGDWTDWVRVLRDPRQPSRYKTANGWETMTRHDEVLHVRGDVDNLLEVTDTRWGPIAANDYDGTPLALAWTAHDPRSLNLNLLQLEQTRDAASALALAPEFGMPAQNFLVGDRAGHIGWTLTGNAFPLRSGFDPQLPADWSAAGRGWTGWLAASDVPHLFDPPTQRLWTANARTVDGDWLAQIGDGGYDLGARARQIRDDLSSSERFDVAALLAVQLDDRALFLSRWHALLQTTLVAGNDPALATLQRLTASWSGRASIDSVDYRLVRAFRLEVIKAVLAPFMAAASNRFPDFEPPSAQGYEAAVWTLLQNRPIHLLDPRYPDWNALLLAAARAVAEPGNSTPLLTSRTWGDLNVARIRHPLSRALPEFLARWIDMPAQAMPGDSNMPRVQAPSFGASERFVIEPGHEERSFLMMPGGQSGHPMSPFHAAGHADWVAGQPTPLLPGPTKHMLVFKPLNR